MKDKKEIMYDFFSMAEKYYYNAMNAELILWEDGAYGYHYIGDNEIENLNNYIASNLGLSLEYYLKGIVFPFLEIKCPLNEADLKIVVDNLTKEEEYKLIIGDESIVQDLSNKWNISKTRIRKLQEESSLKYFSHDTSRLYEFLQNNDKIPRRLKSVLNKCIIDNFDDLDILPYKKQRKMARSKDKEQRELQDIEAALAQMLDNSELNSDINIQEINDEFRDAIEDLGHRYPIDESNKDKHEEEAFYEMMYQLQEESIKSAFPKGRYGFLDGFPTNNYKLLNVVGGIRNGIKEYFNGISIINDSDNFGTTAAAVFYNKGDFNDGYLGQSRRSRLVFPDVGSKIYILDGSNKVSRAYQYDTPINMYARIHNINPQNVTIRELFEFCYSYCRGGNSNISYNKDKPMLFAEFISYDKLIGVIPLKRLVGSVIDFLQFCSIGTDESFDINMTDRVLVHDKPKSILMMRNGKKISYTFINGEILQNKDERTKELEQSCEKYEYEENKLQDENTFEALEKYMKKRHFYSIITGRCKIDFKVLFKNFFDKLRKGKEKDGINR